MDNKKIKIGIIGLGGCASSLIQGLSFYDNLDIKGNVHGLMHEEIAGYRPSDIQVTCAFDVDKRKVGHPLNKAIFEKPNCTKIFNICGGMEPNPIVLKGPVLDGVAPHMKDYFQLDNEQKELTKEEIIDILKITETDVIVNYLPVGSQEATKFYADCCLEAKVAFINAIPVFIASDPIWVKKFKDVNLPVLGDDVKSMVGSTIVNRYLVQMLIDRGAKIDRIYQTNLGGNTDFKNMTDPSRLESKRISKTESISSLIPYDIPIFAGPNGYIESLLDNKISYMRIDFRIFGNIPCSIDLKLSVEDSPGSAGVIIDVIRIAKLALDKKIGGALMAPSAFYFKHPIKQMTDEYARHEVETFINSNGDYHHE